MLNEFFNELAYNPGPNQAGFLFFADWATHDLDSVVSQGEAHGALGQTLLYFNCELVPILKGVAEVDPTAKLILGLLNPPSESLCVGRGARHRCRQSRQRARRQRDGAAGRIASSARAPTPPRWRRPRSGGGG